MNTNDISGVVWTNCNFILISDQLINLKFGSRILVMASQKGKFITLIDIS